MKIIGIAGGSGSGKSSVSWLLVNSDPDRFQVLNSDDYQKLPGDKGLPRLHGMVNWDHPEIIRWEDLIADVKKLRNGHSVTVGTKDRRLNPDYLKHHRRIDRVIEPRPILLIEGYLALHDPRLNRLYDKSIYLDLDGPSREDRRDKEVGYKNEIYNDKVMKPMHDRYVEPTRARADVVIDVSGLSLEEVRDRIRREAET